VLSYFAQCAAISPALYEKMGLGPSLRTIARFRDKNGDTEEERMVNRLRAMVGANPPIEVSIGGILMDEMYVQDGLLINNNKDVVGFVSDWATSYDERLQYGTKAGVEQAVQHSVANSVCVMQYRSLAGTNVPLMYYPCRALKSGELTQMFEHVLSMCERLGLAIVFVSTDGASNFRTWRHSKFAHQGEAWMNLAAPLRAAGGAAAADAPDPDPDVRRIVYIPDFDHIIKKIRNNMLRTLTTDNNKRYLAWGDLVVMWDCVKVLRDQCAAEVIGLRKRITDAVFNPNAAQKMSVELATVIFSQDVVERAKLMAEKDDRQKKMWAGFARMVKDVRQLIVAFKKTGKKRLRLYEDGQLLRDAQAAIDDLLAMDTTHEGTSPCPGHSASAPVPTCVRTL